MIHAGDYMPARYRVVKITGAKVGDLTAEMGTVK